MKPVIIEDPVINSPYKELPRHFRLADEGITDDGACRFIDTNYNGESFFVRHAYFTGADRPYEKLSKALKAEINEDAWEQLYRTKSRPFKKTDTGRIAVKVINHYGDEVLRVYPV